jgi:hypothetical protein
MNLIEILLTHSHDLRQPTLRGEIFFSTYKRNDVCLTKKMLQDGEIDL